MSLYNSADVKDNCGFGLIAHLDGQKSHSIITKAITALDRMTHRGAQAEDGKTGDGCGLLIQFPETFFRQIAKEQTFDLEDDERFAVGTVFFSQNLEKRELAKTLIEATLHEKNLNFLGWRKVPTNSEILGRIASECEPYIEQIFIRSNSGWSPFDLERQLFMARCQVESQIQNDPDFFIPSMSSLVTVYKGLILPNDLENFYLDLHDPRLQTAICLFHQRFATNTHPTWALAQPFRYLAHNGEINTISGNRAWANTKYNIIESSIVHNFNQRILDETNSEAVAADGSDSFSLDNMFEALLAGGMDITEAVRSLVPPAVEHNPLVKREIKDYHLFNNLHMEPWDGPAGLVFTNGHQVACALDRNGLRPARYVITQQSADNPQDQLITVSSEVGIWDYEPASILEKGKLGPGDILLIDTENTPSIYQTEEVDRKLARGKNYSAWLKEHLTELKTAPPFLNYQSETTSQTIPSMVYKKLFNFSYEEIEQIIKPLSLDAQEATGSMGDDTPIAVMSSRVRNVSDYFRQLFAQVTNPAIDPLRERHVMSLNINLGVRENILNRTANKGKRIKLEGPVLTDLQIQKIRQLKEGFEVAEISLLVPTTTALAQAITDLCQVVEEKIRAQKSEISTIIVILTDKNIKPGHYPIPTPFAVGALHQYLITKKIRLQANIILETASARDSHQYALLIGLGATAIYPYFTYDILAELHDKDLMGGHSDNIPDKTQTLNNYRQGIHKGLLKIMSKMGIATLASYRGAQLFEALGIGPDVVTLCFPRISSRIAGASFEDFNQDLLWLAKTAWQPHKPLVHGGYLKYVDREEFHTFNPDVVQSLQAVSKTGHPEDYQTFSDYVNLRPPTVIRDLFKLNVNTTAIDINEVAPVEHLYSRLDSAAMSLGALSREAHQSIAEGMNRLGGFSNSGEGGEDPHRYTNPRLNSKIKQIASGRFGASTHYLASAHVIQIKIAQGAKPGEGGQIPGSKVSAEIASLRNATEGQTFISPPPHHDIYSIEDLSQLIFDLKQVNPSALISVKLVSEPGIGIIATGVTKAYADMITIAGYDGGTGASPLSSVKYAGSPWELGIAEVHEALIKNGLRHRVRLQVDGGLKTGLDVIKAAILGAQSFGFGTAPMIAIGCKFLRICHLNNCATGIATQNPRLRRDHFVGTADKLMNYFKGIAAEVRVLLAQLGFKHIDDIIGRVDLLERITTKSERIERLDLAPILQGSGTNYEKPLPERPINPPVDKAELNQQIVHDVNQAITDNRLSMDFNYAIKNTDRTVGALLSGYIAALAQGKSALPLTKIPEQVNLHFTGNAGQSFGAWLVDDITVTLQGDANDYVGKGLSGGTISIRSPGTQCDPRTAVVMGNTCLYGAIRGKLFADGVAGERFAVRNSGASAVINGLGEHGCEYMTGGVIVVLGKIGINFGAGMTGGLAYVQYTDDLEHRINHDLVEIIAIDHPIAQQGLQQLLQQHIELTASEVASELLQNFSQTIKEFRLIKPKIQKMLLPDGPDGRDKKVAFLGRLDDLLTQEFPQLMAAQQTEPEESLI